MSKGLVTKAVMLSYEDGFENGKREGAIQELKRIQKDFKVYRNCGVNMYFDRRLLELSSSRISPSAQEKEEGKV